MLPSQIRLRSRQIAHLRPLRAQRQRRRARSEAAGPRSIRNLKMRARLGPPQGIGKAGRACWACSPCTSRAVAVGSPAPSATSGSAPASRITPCSTARGWCARPCTACPTASWRSPSRSPSSRCCRCSSASSGPRPSGASSWRSPRRWPWPRSCPRRCCAALVASTSRSIRGRPPGTAGSRAGPRRGSRSRRRRCRPSCAASRRSRTDRGRSGC